MVEQSLVDVSAGTVPGMTTLPHLHQLSITGPTGLPPAFPIRRAAAKSSPAAPWATTKFRVHAKSLPDSRSRLIEGRSRRTISRAFLGIYQRGRNGGNFDSGIRTALQAMIASPEFVFRDLNGHLLAPPPARISALAILSLPPDSLIFYGEALRMTSSSLSPVRGNSRTQ